MKIFFFSSSSQLPLAIVGTGRGCQRRNVLRGLAAVCLEMRRQVVAAGKLAVALLASVRAGARVLAVVARQLVRAGKAPVAVVPGADKRALASVRAHVRLEVRALGVALVAALVVAGEWPVAVTAAAAAD